MKAITDLVQPQICDLQPYKPGLPIEEIVRQFGIAQQDVVKLASNENPDGMSPRTAEAAHAALTDALRYPDGYELRNALASFYGLQDANIVLGNGSNDVLDLIARVFLGKGAESVSSEHGFIVYRLVTQITGATNIIVPAKDFGHDLTAMQVAITDATRVVWIANPNNPTGTFIPYTEVKAFLEAVPEHVMVVLDEAYYEYLSDDQRVDTVKWLQAHPNLILTRTFSKAYGLAGLRVGYALAAPEVADMLSRVRQPFNVTNVSLAAATAALADQQFVTTSRTHNQQGLMQLKKGLDELGLSSIPTSGNFITIAFEQAAAVQQALLRQGVIVRPLLEYGMPNHLRVTVGTKDENIRFLHCLQKALNA